MGTLGDRILNLQKLLFLGGGAVLILGRHTATYAPETPYAAHTILHLLGLVLLGWGVFAAALLHMPVDAPGRDRALLWFLAGQWITVLILLVKYQAIFGNSLPLWPAGILLHAVVLLSLWRLFRRRTVSPHPDLRSRYEQEIRRAACQEERHRLARDLHDSIKQQIFAIHTSAATAQAALAEAPAAADTAIRQVREFARDAMREMETLLDQLEAAPVSLTGLAASLERLREAVALRTGAKVTLEIANLRDIESRLPPGTPLALLRTAQEALSNAARHARPSQIDIALAGAGYALSLTIVDNGAGFDPSTPARGMGRNNMEARARELGAECTLETAPGQGTRVTVQVPLAPEAQSGLKSSYISIGLAVLFIATAILGQRLFPDTTLTRLLQPMTAAFLIFLLLYHRARQSRGFLK